MSIKSGLDNIWKNSEKYYSGIGKLWCLIDWGYCFLRYGATPTDYFMDEFPKKSGRERATFITARDFNTIYAKINCNDNSLLEDKIKFNTHMKEFMHRDWLYCDDKCTYRKFENFIKKHPTIIVKPADGMQGQGVWQYRYNKKDDLKKVYEEKIKGSLIEEKLIQHPALEKLAPGSVNCLRINTLNWGDGRVDIVSCGLKTGGGKSPVDNLHAGGGVGAAVDIETGVIFTKAKNWDQEEFVYHPFSHEKIVGFEIPHWDIVVRDIKKAAKKIPDTPYIGWDCAVTKDGIALIEGNIDSGPVLAQMFDVIGKKPLLEKFVKEKRS